MLIKYNKKDMFKLLEEEFLNKGYGLKILTSKLNIHMGTIKRWLVLKEVPPQYFYELNTILNNKYELDVSDDEKYKIFDQFFTNQNTAKELVNKSLDFIKNNYDVKLSDYTLIEPSAGDGAFYNNFPKEFNSIGIDIFPQNNCIIQKNFFEFTPKTTKNIVIGNPPFGLRGQLALKFINHASDFADFICFILPPLFNSNGKGSPRLRVDKKMSLVYEIPVHNIFRYPNNKEVVVNSIFQIWTKIESSKVEPIKVENKTSNWIKVYALSNGSTPASKRNVKMIDYCDVYLPSTCFEEVVIKDSFYKLPNSRGYGVVALKEKEKVIKLLKEIDWTKISFKSTNGANNLRTQLIINAIEKEMNK